jgi:ubiquinone/menaquinone biosynthesis C-methylase UbiE
MLREYAPIEHSSAQGDFRLLFYLANKGAADIHPLGPAASRALIAELDVQPEQEVLEVGCGTGSTMVRVAQQKPARIDGVDVMPSMLAVARKRLRLVGVGKRATVRLVRDGERLPFADASYDAAYTESVLGFRDEEWVKAILAEIFRVLKPGGRFVANEAIWRAGVSAERVAAVNAACLADFGVRQASAEPWALSDWLEVIRDMGFRVLKANTVKESVAQGSENQRPGARALLSAALTQFYRLRGYFTPAMREARADYLRLSQKHRLDGLLIEPRLFVLEKPPASREL